MVNLGGLSSLTCWILEKAEVAEVSAIKIDRRL